jgi:hypothetical protein
LYTGKNLTHFTLAILAETVIERKMALNRLETQERQQSSGLRIGFFSVSLKLRDDLGLCL